MWLNVYPMAEQRKHKGTGKKRRKIRNSKIFNKILQGTIGTWLERNCNVTGENLEIFERFEPPYFIMSTHNCVFDPFMIADFVPAPISYVVGDAAFRSPLMGWALSLVGSIPKTKAVSDSSTIKHIMDVKKRKGVIGLFPEGQSPWDGHSLPVVYSTAKLIKLLKIPVIIAEKQGAFFSKPRWAKERRKGRVTIRFAEGFTPEELKESSADDLYKKLTDLLEHDEYELQRRDMVRFEGKDRAEYLELALFVCPECRGLCTLRSEGDELGCGSCGYTVHYNEYCFFELRKGSKLHHDSIRNWNLWQTDFLKGYLSRNGSGGRNTPIFTDEEIDAHTGYMTDPMVERGRGTLEFYTDRVDFKGNKAEYSFPIDSIEGVNVHENEKLEFYHEDTLYRFDSDDPRKSIYKWYLGIKLRQGGL